MIKKSENGMNNILKSKIKDLFNTGFFYILGSSFLNKIIAFITNAVLTRILTKEEMGIFSGAFNAYFIVYLFSGLGITSGMLYFCAKDKEWAEKNSYYNFSFWFGMISEVILSAILVFYGLYNKSGILESRKYMVGLAILPFVSFFFDYYSIILRAEKDNKHYSIISNLNTVFYLIFGVLGALFGRIWGTIIGRYLAFIVSDIIGHCFCKQYVNFHKSNKLGYEKTKDLVKYSLKAGLTSSLNVILYRLDVTVIDLVLADASILAAYKIGTTLPENMNFIPQCFMIYFMPLFLQHIKEQEWIKKKTKEVYLVIGAVSIVLGLIMYLFAPIIISIIWGKQYLDAVPCFRILTISFVLLSIFRITSTNLLLTLKRAGYTTIVSIITGIANIVLDVIFTIKYGSIGAAYATLIVTILASVMSFPYAIYIIYSGKQKYE